MSATGLLLGATLVAAATATHDDGAPAAPALADSASLSLAFAPTIATPARVPWQDDAVAPPTDDAAVPAVPPSFGAAGTTRWYVQLGGASDFASNDANFGLLGIGLSHFVAEDLALNFEFNVMLFDQPGNEAGGLNLGMLLQWHFAKERDASWFVEAGIGVLGTNDKVPDGGSGFNFTPQAGIGYMYDVGGGARFVLGTRWFHISNAQMFEENPGRDSVMFYAGMSFPY